MAHRGEALEQELIRGALTGRERSLIRILFFHTQDEADYRNLFDGLDPDQENICFLLTLSVLGFSTGWARFPAELVPRLKGIHRYYQVDAAVKFAWLAGILKCLEAEGIPVMHLKGGAMYVYYRKGSPRIMDDFDAAVPAELFDKAASLLEAQGCERVRSSPWADTFQATVLGRRTSIDLHRRILKNAPDADRPIREHALHAVFQGMPVCVPSPADMFLHLLDNQARNLFFHEHPGRRIKWISDCCRILEAYPDSVTPAILRELSERCHDTFHVTLALRILSARLPEIFPRRDVEEAFPVSREYYDWIVRGIAFRDSYTAVCAYPGNGPLTPRRFCVSLRRRVNEYRLLSPEFRAQGAPVSFVSFFCMQTGCRNPGEALKKYLPRLRLREKDAFSSPES